MRKKPANLPFKVGQSAEARSFWEGFRGAWFLCKIMRINKREQIYTLKYPHFPEEKPERLKLYQSPVDIEGNEIEGVKEMMIRPCFPTIFCQNKMPPESEIPKEAVIVDNTWKVGDLVDWWKDDCFWSGTIIQLLEDGKAKIELKPPPVGEGTVDETLLKDVRPSLDWSLENGWTLPTQDEGTGRPCALLRRPSNQVQDTQHAGHEAQKQAESLTMPYPTSSPSSSSEPHTLEKMQVQKQSMEDIASKERIADTQQKTISADCGRGTADTVLKEAIDVCTQEKPTSADDRSRCADIVSKGAIDVGTQEKPTSADCRSGSADTVSKEAIDVGTLDKPTSADCRSGSPMELDGIETNPKQSRVRIHEELDYSCSVNKARADEGAILPNLIKKEMAIGVGTQSKTRSADSGSGSPMELDGTETNPDQSPVRIHENDSCPLKKACEGTILHYQHWDSAEAAVLDLEACLTKIKCLKSLLRSVASSSDATSSSNAAMPDQWELVESNIVSSRS